MNSTRYSRQTILKDFGPVGQEKLARAKVLVVGAGGLGVPVMTYLNAMGVGTLGLVDNDIVSASNLHRQVLYGESDIGKSKVAVAIEKLNAQNSETLLTGYPTFLTTENALEIIREYDMVVDASDNFPTRYLINDACVILKKPFVYGALHGFEGQVSVFNFQQGPTYRCLFKNMPRPAEIPSCEENGVLGIIPGIVGNFQAMETIKVITGIGEVLSGKLLLYNGLDQSLTKIKFSRLNKNLDIEALKSTYDFDCQVPVSAIGAPEFELLHSSEDVVCIDVRTRSEFNAFHLPKTVNIPLAEMETRINEISANGPVYVICQSGVRSHQAVATLRELQPKTTFINVKGGINNLNAYATKY
ncbi:MAG: HesA/MoeB/ThiF family protein [Maribacter sp.]|nr:HesA/MoeB/ThiF family protein [Maribacter sp.]